MTPAGVQKYAKVFLEVDSDRDGKITGEQARNLFLSWRLPRGRHAFPFSFMPLAFFSSLFVIWLISKTFVKYYFLRFFLSNVGMTECSYVAELDIFF